MFHQVMRAHKYSNNCRRCFFLRKKQEATKQNSGMSIQATLFCIAWVIAKKFAAFITYYCIQLFFGGKINFTSMNIEPILLVLLYQIHNRITLSTTICSRAFQVHFFFFRRHGRKGSLPKAKTSAIFRLHPPALLQMSHMCYSTLATSWCIEEVGEAEQS